MPQQEQEQEEK